MTPTVNLTIRGAEFRPACERAHLICAIAQRRALEGDQVQMIKRVGLDVVIVNDRRKLPRDAQ